MRRLTEEDGPTRWQDDARAAAFAALLTLGSGLTVLDGWRAGDSLDLTFAVGGGAALALSAFWPPLGASWRRLLWMAVWVALLMYLMGSIMGWTTM
jgi:hypothetical protein